MNALRQIVERRQGAGGTAFVPILAMFQPAVEIEVGQDLKFTS